MKYHIYFHDDFDGVACAALLWQFFHWRGDDVISLEPITYSLAPKQEWPSYPFKSPFALVDFRYHPRAAWWFDHHATTFFEEKWRRQYRNDNQHCLNPAFPSCFGLVADFLKRTYYFNLSGQLKRLVPWVNRIDSAAYFSPRQALEIRSAAQKLSFLLDEKKEDEKSWRLFQRQAIKELAFGNLNEFLRRPNLRRRLNGLAKKIALSYRLYRRHAVINGKTAFLDKTSGGKKVIHHHFISRALFPDLSYSIIVNRENGNFHVGVARNHWLTRKSKLHLGRLMKKYGGGGHQDIGAMEIKTKKEALRSIGKIIRYLNAYG